MKKGISLITLIITIVITIILSAVVILTLNNRGTIDNAKIAALASDYNSLQTSISLYFTNIVTSNLDMDFDKEKILFGQFGDSLRLVEKSGEEFVEVVINKNNEEIYVYKLDEEICKSKGIKVPKTPSNECSWYISKEGLIYLVYNENSTILSWIIGNPPEGKQIENETLDRFVAKIGEWEKEPSIYDLIPVADATMFSYTTASNGTVSITGFNTNYAAEIPTEIKFPTTDPNGNEIIGINANAFKKNTNLTKIVITEGITTLGNNVFDSCTSLKEVYLPTTIKSIYSSGNSPFYGCNKIEKITIPNFIVSNSSHYPSSLFMSSKSTINTVNFANEITSIANNAFNSFTALKSITIPNGVTTIGNSAFYNCTSLSGKIIIPESVTTIGGNAFYNCSNVSEVEFLSKGDLKTISARAFYKLNLITKVIIPEGVETLENNVFDSCTSIKEVYLPTTLKSIYSSGNSPFNNCTKIEKVTIPNFIVSNSDYYPSNVFKYSNEKINTVNFVGEITSIANNAFNGFTALKNITIPNGVTTIGGSAFNGCTNLNTIVYSGSATGAPWGATNATVVSE